jgi:hypothetical protein
MNRINLQQMEKKELNLKQKHLNSILLYKTKRQKQDCKDKGIADQGELQEDW